MSGTASPHRPGDEPLGELARAVVDAAPDGIVVTDEEGRILLVNPRTEQLFGCGRDELLGQHFQAFLSEGFGETYRACCARFRSRMANSTSRTATQSSASRRRSLPWLP